MKCVCSFQCITNILASYYNTSMSSFIAFLAGFVSALVLLHMIKGTSYSSLGKSIAKSAPSSSKNAPPAQKTTPPFIVSPSSTPSKSLNLLISRSSGATTAGIAPLVLTLNNGQDVLVTGVVFIKGLTQVVLTVPFTVFGLTPTGVSSAKYKSNTDCTILAEIAPRTITSRRTQIVIRSASTKTSAQDVNYV